MSYLPLQRQKAVLQFLDEAISCCQFDISGDDQERMKKVLLDELRVEAENLGMDLDAFWEMFHEQFLVQLEPDLDKAGAMQADRRIREILFVGAWAERKGVRIREQDYVQMYHLEEYELGEQDKRMLAFCCLEESLLTQTDSRLENYRMGGFQLKDSKLRDSTPFGESVHWQTVSREVEKLGDEINREISRINLRVLRDEGDEKEQTLMTHYPVLEYDYSNNELVVKMVAEDSQGREEAIQLFQELISDKEGIQFRFITSDEFVEFIDY